ncbi:hypothetical protein AN1V17_51010 [Vallitalea sediminicola]
MVNKFKKIIFASIMVCIFTQALPVAAHETNGTDSVCISMEVNSKKALLNGEPITLNNAPFLENGIVYVPLREIINLYGGIVAYIQDEQAVLMAIKRKNSMGYDKGCFSKIWIGKQKVLTNTGEAFIHPTYPKNCVPIIKNNIAFIPADYIDFCLVANSLWDAERNRIILYDPNDGLRVDKFVIGSDFNSLDKNIRDRFKTTGRIIDQSEDDLFKIEAYSDGDMEVELMTNVINEEIPPKEIYSIILITDKYKTSRGLRVGDSIEKYWDLYGSTQWVPDHFIDKVDENGIMTIHYDYFFIVEIDNGKVSKISIR